MLQRRARRWTFQAQRKFFDKVAEELNVQTQQDWYKVRKADVVERGGAHLISTFHKSSVIRALKHVYPEFEWHTWSFQRVTPNYWKDVKNQREYFDWLSDSLGVQSFDKWYRLVGHKMGKKSGAIHSQHRSVQQTLSIVYPEKEWHEWDQQNVPKLFWTKQHNQRKYLDWLYSTLNFKDDRDWYQITYDVIKSNGGKGIIEHFNYSTWRMLQSAYPEKEWSPWLFVTPSKDWAESWTSLPQHKKYFDWLSFHLDIDTQQRWYRVTSEHVSKRHGKALLDTYYSSSLHSALKYVYPEFQWYPWLFEETSKELWNDVNIHHQYFEWLTEELNIRTHEDWYNIRASEVCMKGGECLLKEHYDGSLFKALVRIYPHIEWNEWHFVSPCVDESKDLISQRNFFDTIAAELNITKEKWYEVSSDVIIKRGGNWILQNYNGSMYRTLSALYPEEEFHPWLFRRTPKSFWRNVENQKKAMRWLIQKENINIEKLDDWSRLTSSIMRKSGLTTLLHYYGSPFNSVQNLFPEYEVFDDKHSSAAQRNIWKVLNSIPRLKDKVLLNYKHPSLLHKDSERVMELDIYLPSLQIALEYQGLHHYQQGHFEFHPSQVKRDLEKKKACSEIGIDLIQIPYWWDGSKSTLISTILKQCPHLYAAFKM